MTTASRKKPSLEDEVNDLRMQVSELKTSEYTLMGEVERLKQLEENARAEAEECARNLQEIMYIASHDFQAPLVSIDGYIDILQETAGTDWDDEGRFCLDRIQFNSRRLHALVLGLLDLSRLHTRPFPHESFDPAQVAAGVVDALETGIEEQGAVVTVEPLPLMEGDRQRLTAVFRHLISNALIYGGKNITVGFLEDRQAWFVEDDGIGIPPEHLETIFSAGQRLKREKKETGGAGMGLLFCRKVMTQHGGRIWAESEGDGKGSAFYFKFDDEKI